MKHVGILGISYCGSTILSYLLGKSKDILSLGETHWAIDFPERNSCVAHRKDCDFWTRDFVESLTWKNFFKKVENRTKEQFPEINTLIYSDKNAGKYIKYKQYSNTINSAILLFKSPESFAISYIENHINRPTGYTRKELKTTSCHLYTNNYANNLFFLFENKIPFISIFYDDFIKSPENTMKHIFSFLGVENPKDLLEDKIDNRKAHQLGGNSNAHKKPKNIVPDYRWKTNLSKSELDFIWNNKESRNIYSYLKTRKNKIWTP